MNQSNNSSFQGLGIAPKLLEVLERNKLTIPTPIQQQAIPFGIEGKDIMGIAQTGTGKTLAFGIPMLQRLAKDGGRGLVLLPTRELAIQVDESLQRIGRSFGLKTAVLIGGESFDRQLRRLKAKPHIIIATPGRLNDHLDRKTVKLDKTSILVLDEADRMLDMGFLPQLKNIFEQVPEERQTMLFSATMPANIVGLAARYMKLPTRVEVAPAGTSSDNIQQEIFFVHKLDKPQVLAALVSEFRGSILVFTRTKHEAKKVARTLNKLGHRSAELHSNRSLGQRREALEGFKVGRFRVLVATDIAARGIDVKGIELVINYDLPENAEDYVHRIGRTGRAGNVGQAISLVMPQQQADVKSIERLIKKSLPIRKKKAEGIASLDLAPLPDRPAGGFKRRGAGRARAGGARPATPRRSGGRGRFSRPVRYAN